MTKSTTLQTSGAGSASSGTGTGNNNTIVALNGLVPSASGTFTLNIQSNNSTFGYVNSAALTSVPEPASLSLLGLGGLALVRRRAR